MDSDQRWDPWKRIGQNPSMLGDVVVDENFLHLLYQKKVLSAEEREWLVCTFLTDSDDKRSTNLWMVLLYTILMCTRRPDSYRSYSYSIFQYALAKTNQLGALSKLTYLTAESIDGDGHQQDDQFTESSQSKGASSASFGFDVRDKPLYRVDVIVDQTMCIEIQESQKSICTWLSGKLNSLDPMYIEIRPHVAHFPPTATGQRKLTIIFPVTEGSERGSSNSISIEQLIPDGGVSNCHVELIPVEGLDHLFTPLSEDFLRDDFAGDTAYPTSRDTKTGIIFSPRHFEYDKQDDRFLKQGRLIDVTRVNIPCIKSRAALKRFARRANEPFGEHFEREHRALFEKLVRHKNIIQLIGVCIRMPGDMDTLVLEYAEYGNLDTLLTHHLAYHPSIRNDRSWTLRTNMALDVARGMTIVHEKIVHLDLKTSNVLVGKDYLCKISDFGSAEFPSDSKYSQFRIRGIRSKNTTAFIAPERFEGSRWKQKKKADVYGYGMTLFQLKELQKPWAGETSASQIKEKVLNQERPNLGTADGCPDCILRLIKKCWTHDPIIRPTFQEIVSDLTEMETTSISQRSTSVASSGYVTGVSHYTLNKRLVTADTQPTKGSLQWNSSAAGDTPIQEESAGAAEGIVVTGGSPYTGRVDPKSRGVGDDKVYPMNLSPSGRALIINNVNFSKNPNQEKHGTDKEAKDLQLNEPDLEKKRNGSDKDADDLQQLFEGFDFEVELRRDQTAAEIQTALEELAFEDHSEYNCVIVAVLTHGYLGHDGQGYICGTDREGLRVTDFLHHFRNCKSLVGKPKLFFFEFCRGDGTTSYASSTTQTSDVPKSNEVNWDVFRDSHHEDSDVLLSFATTHGSVAYRKEDSGTRYVQTLVEVFYNCAHENHLSEMLAEVRRKMDAHVGCEQIAPEYTTLTKKLYFSTESGRARNEYL